MTAPSLATTAPADVAAQPRPAAAQRATQRTLRVLVVEDEPLTAQIFALALARDGMDVDVCRNGLQAQKRIEQRRPSAVVLDMSLPLRSGADLLRHLRAVGLRDLPVIVFGLAHVDLWPGAWVDKPVRPRDLVAVVREFLTDPR
jgi:DNA-binding response OmpR family regulator